MVVIRENVMNGKWLIGKEKELRLGRMSFKLNDIKLTEGQPSGTTGERCRTITQRERRQMRNRKKGLRSTTWHCDKGSQTAQQERNARIARQEHSSQG